jgi:hypothetical protein
MGKILHLWKFGKNANVKNVGMNRGKKFAATFLPQEIIEYLGETIVYEREL